jgi:hypothetical protein
MWFGKRYPAPIYDDIQQTETPVGTRCAYCGEGIEAGDDGFLQDDGIALHRECQLRMIFGSVAHQEKRCSCCGGTGSDQDDGMTRREGARAAVKHLREH